MYAHHGVAVFAGLAGAHDAGLPGAVDLAFQPPGLTAAAGIAAGAMNGGTAAGRAVVLGGGRNGDGDRRDGHDGYHQFLHHGLLGCGSAADPGVGAVR